MNLITAQMNWLLMLLNKIKNSGIILLGLVLISCSDELKQPEEILQPPQKLIEDFDRFDPSLNGFFYADLELMKNDPAYAKIGDWLGESRINIGELRIDKYKQFLADFGINKLDLFSSLKIAVYNSENSTDYAAIIRGKFDNSVLKQKTEKAGFDSPVMVSNSMWLFNENNRLFIRFVGSHEIELTTKPELFVSEGSGSLVVSRLINENFRDLNVRNQMLYYFGLPENLQEKIKKATPEDGLSVNFSDDPPVYLKGIVYFNQGIKSRNFVGFESENGLLAASGTAKTVLGFITLKSFVNNETTIAEFIDVSKQDSTLQFDLILPEEKISKLHKGEN